MADHICWGELVGELTHILARAKRMKKFQHDADVYWEVDELSHQQKEWYLDPNNEGFKNFIHDKPYTTKADLYRIRFYGPKIKVNAKNPPPKRVKVSTKKLKPVTAEDRKRVEEAARDPSIKRPFPSIHGNPAFTMEAVGKQMDDALAKRAKQLAPIPDNVYYSPGADNFYSKITKQGMGTAFYMQWKDRKSEFEQNDRLTHRVVDVTQEEAANRARIPTKEEQRDVRENGMLGEGTRDHLVIFVRDGGISTTENVTLSEALHLARHSKDCVAHVVKIVQTLDNRKTPLERARDRVHMVLENLAKDGQPDDKEMLDLYAAVEAWKQVAGQHAWNVLRPGTSQ